MRAASWMFGLTLLASATLLPTVSAIEFINVSSNGVTMNGEEHIVCGIDYNEGRSDSVVYVMLAEADAAIGPLEARVVVVGTGQELLMNSWPTFNIDAQRCFIDLIGRIPTERDSMAIIYARNRARQSYQAMCLHGRDNQQRTGRVNLQLNTMGSIEDVTAQSASCGRLFADVSTTRRDATDLLYAVGVK